MMSDQPGTSRGENPPELLYDETSLPCGYAPRTIQLSTGDRDVLFIGCKDGSVAVLCGSRETGVFDPDTLPSRESGSAVRTICEWVPGEILVGRRDGTIEHRRLSGNDEGFGWWSEVFGKLPQKRTVLTIARLDAERVVFCLLNTGSNRGECWILRQDSEGKPTDLERLELPSDYRAGIRFVAPLSRTPGRGWRGVRWLLVSERGDLLYWDGELKNAVKRLRVPWPQGEFPGAVNDIGLWRSDADRRVPTAARGLFLATDVGVYLVTLNEELEPEGCRLSLPGLGSVCTALSYTEGAERRYLWVADSSGDSHLFWDTKIRGEEESSWLNFRRTGLVHAQSQVLVCFAWYDPSGKSLLFGQARRDDRVVIGRYRAFDDLDASQIEQGSADEIRWLLSRGPIGGDRGIRSHLEDLEEDRRSHEQSLDSGAPKSRRVSSGGDTEAERRSGEPDDGIVLAHFFESLGSEAWTRELLLESLLNYHSAADEILKSEISKPDGGSKDRIECLLQVWTLSLLGVIHRHPSDHERKAAYLALLRWLRNRQHRLRELFSPSDEPLAEAVGAVFEVSVRFARKWGVYGEANAWREDLVSPLRRLALQESAERGRSEGREDDLKLRPAPLDELIYQVLLYDREASLIHQAPGKSMRGRTAWDLATVEIPLGDGTRPVLAAVSWRWGGIDLVELDRSTEPGETRLRPRGTLSPVGAISGAGEGAETRDGPLEGPKPRFRYVPPPPPGRDPKIFRTPYWHTRAVHLGLFQRRPYLIVSQAAGPELIDQIEVWRLDRSSDGGAWTASPDAVARLDSGRDLKLGHESVYSFAEIAEGALVVGLQGEGETAHVGLLELRDSGGSLSLVWKGVLRLAVAFSESSEVDGAGPDSAPATGRRQAGTNRVRALASGPVVGNTCRVVVGCERGEIFRCTLEHGADGWDWHRPSKPADQLSPIARLSSPVLALGYRESGSNLVRLFAGGEDGAVVAWQEVGRAESPNGVGEAPGSFVSLWATSEQSAISGIHLLDDIVLFDQEQADPPPTVVVMTRSGRAVLFDDRPLVGMPGSPKRRTPLPGCRHGRPFLGSSCFASRCLPGGAVRWLDPLEPMVQVLVASGEGSLRLVGLHDLNHTDRRDKQYEEILRRWRQVTWEEHQIRLPGAIYRAAPATELVIVRRLLDRPDPPQEATSENPVLRGAGLAAREPRVDDGPYLPRHLRPLLDLYLAWDALREAEDRSTVETEAFKTGVNLGLALRRAWQLADLELFQEICEVVLKRANLLLCEVLGPDQSTDQTEHRRDDPERWNLEKLKLELVYEAIFGVLDRTVQRWLGASEEAEARIHMVVVKHMVDGETFWCLVREVRKEIEQQSGDQSVRSCREILNLRIDRVSQLISRRHRLVRLEALRAANLSLFRLCRRLTDERRAESSWTPGVGEVDWSIFEPYFRHLLAAGARSFGSPLDLDDALSHEFERTFALSLCACPSATIRIANRMAETRLITDPDSEDDLSFKVLSQLYLLRDLGLSFPDSVIVLFDAVARPRRGEVSPLDRIRDRLGGSGELRSRVTEHATEPGTWAVLGRENAEDLVCLAHLYDGVVGWFLDLERQLAEDAQSVDLTSAAEAEIKERLKSLGSTDREHLYQHSFEFWSACVKALWEETGSEEGPRPVALRDSALRVLPCARRSSSPASRWGGGRESLATG